MNENDFLENYLKPSVDLLDRAFTHSLPPIQGLERRSCFIVQSEVKDTFSTNIATKYESDAQGIRLVEVYKNTQNRISGLFVRLVGSMSLVKTGYPFVVLDASVRNVTKSAPEQEAIATRVAVHLPQAGVGQRIIFFGRLSKEAKKAGISYGTINSDEVPAFWGKVWMGQDAGINLDMIRQLRDYSWYAYRDIIERTQARTPFDYRPVQEEMVLNASRREHLVFESRGLSVPTEAQAAFFSVMVSDV